MNLEKVVKYSVPLFVLAIVSRSIEEISFIYYAVPVFCVFYIFLMFISSRSNIQSQKSNVISQKDRTESQSPESELVKRSDSLFATLKRMTPMLLFLIPGTWFLLSSLWSSFPEISAARALYFILISLGSISAGILWIRYSDNNIFDFLLPANVVIVLIALFSLITNIPSDSWTGGHGKGFIGFFGHQNLLASVILFTLPSVLAKIKVQSKKLKVLLFILLTLNFILLILTYSRSSILSLVIGAIVFLILNRSCKVLAYGFAIIALFVITIYSIPSLNQTVDKIIKKDFPEVYSSRIWMWEPSYRAAQNGGLTGLGYGMSDPNIKPGSLGDHYEGERFVREKGNSSLALIEEAGLIGLILFLIPIIYVAGQFRMYNLEFRMKGNKHNNYTLYILHSSFAAMLLHAQFEAWWVGVGSVQLPLFFIYLGLAVYKLPVMEI